MSAEVLCPGCGAHLPPQSRHCATCSREDINPNPKIKLRREQGDTVCPYCGCIMPAMFVRHWRYWPCCKHEVTLRDKALVERERGVFF